MEDTKISRLAGASSLAPVVIEPRKAIDLSPMTIVSGETDEHSESLLVDYFRLLFRRRWTIALCALAGAVLGFLLTVTVLPVFRARTSLDIQNLNADFMNRRAVALTGEDSNSSTESYVQTQIKLLQSDALLARTVQHLKTQANAQPVERMDLLSQWQRSLGLGANEAIDRGSLIENAAKQVKVKPLGMTRLVEITCDSWNPVFAAKFCNSLTREFAEQDREIRWNEAQKTSEWLSRQLADVREKLQQSEKKLEATAGADALIYSGENSSSVGEDRLRQIQSELMKAQADRVAKQAQFEISTSVAPDSLAPVLDNGPLREYQMKLVDLRRQLAELVPPLTDEHPKVRHIKSQIAEMETTLSKERGNVMGRMKNEFSAARQRENLLSLAYSAQERKVAHELGRSTQFNMLRHEVESGQQLYQTLLQRVKEAGFASAMQATTIRVVDPATAPKIPIAPKRSVSSTVGLLLGTFFGIAFAFIRERTDSRLRAPGDAQRLLHVRELGVIPSARASLKAPYLKKAVSKSANTSLIAAPASAVLRPTEGEPLDLITWTDRSSLMAEAYRNTTYSILLASKEKGRCGTYVVTSPHISEGKTTLVCNLGISLAQAKRRVLLVDGDLRRPRLHKAFGVPNEFGMRNLLRGEFQLDTCALADMVRPTAVPGLSILCSGGGDEEASGLLHSPYLEELLERMAREFDVVLIDSPPVLHLADARILGGNADGAILVMRSRVTNRDTATVARDMFLHDRIPLLGVILNDFDPTREGRVRYYNEYYQYESRAEQGERRSA